MIFERKIMLTLEEKKTIYSIIKGQFPDSGVYRTSRISEWLMTNGYSLEKMGYNSFRDFAEDFPELFSFQNDYNDVFIVVGEWEEGERSLQRNRNSHPADAFFGSQNIVLNDDIIEMSQQSLYALTKILGNGLNVQEMKQEVYNRFEAAKADNKLTFLGEKYTFPIGCCQDGFLVRGIVTKNISPRGKSLYFAFEKTQICGTPEPELRKRPAVTQQISEEDKVLIYKLITDNFPTEKPLHMAAVSKLLTDNNIDRTKYGFFKMKELLAELDFLELHDIVLGGVPQIMVTVHARRSLPHNDAPARPAYEPHSTERPVRETGVYRYSESISVPDGALETFCKIPIKPLEILRAFLEKHNIIKYQGELFAELGEDFAAARSENNIRFFEGKMIFPCRYTKDDGTPVEITLKPSTFDIKGRPWFLYYVDTTVRTKSHQTVYPGMQLENFAFLGSWSSFLSDLAEKAIDEEWDFAGNSGRNYQILIQYIKYTFVRLQNEGKICISSDNQFAAFNTGLVDKHYDDIYACFVPNEPENDTKWKFTGFCTAASGGLGKMIVNYFSPLPQPPRYFTKKEDLLFDHEKELHPDFEHIIIDNISRFPVKWLYEQFYDSTDARNLAETIMNTENRAEKKAAYDELKAILADNTRLFLRIKDRLRVSIDLAIKRVRWNYKTAIPSYFPKRDSLSLMLPLCLVDEEKADIALVVEQTLSGNYQGQTILTIPQAYIDARLMCRLTSDWLNPQQILGGYDDVDLGTAFEELSEMD